MSNFRGKPIGIMIEKQADFGKQIFECRFANLQRPAKSPTVPKKNLKGDNLSS